VHGKVELSRTCNVLGSHPFRAPIDYLRTAGDAVASSRSRLVAAIGRGLPETEQLCRRSSRVARAGCAGDGLSLLDPRPMAATTARLERRIAGCSTRYRLSTNGWLPRRWHVRDELNLPCTAALLVRRRRCRLAASAGSRAVRGSPFRVWGSRPRRHLDAKGASPAARPAPISEPGRRLMLQPGRITATPIQWSRMRWPHMRARGNGSRPRRPTAASPTLHLALRRLALMLVFAVGGAGAFLASQMESADHDVR